MTPITLTLELHHNSRVIQGLNAVEEHWTSDYGFAVMPGTLPGKDIIQVTLEGLDLGRFDASGDAYLVDLLNIVAGDLISWWVEEEG